MKMFPLLLAVIATTVLAGSVAAQATEEEATKDFLEFALFGGGSVPIGGIADWSVTSPTTGTEQLGTKLGYSFGFDVGHFLTPSLVVGVDLLYAQYGVDATQPDAATLHHRLISPAAYVKHYFLSESNLLPYVKGQVGVDVVKFATKVYDPNVDGQVYRELSYHPALALGIGGGLMYYTFDYGGIYAEANYHMAFTSNVQSNFYDRTYEFGTTTSVFDIHAGVKIFFGGE